MILMNLVALSVALYYPESRLIYSMYSEFIITNIKILCYVRVVPYNKEHLLIQVENY